MCVHFVLFCFAYCRRKAQRHHFNGKIHDCGNSKKLNVGSEPKRTHPKCLSWQGPLDPSSPPHCIERAGGHLTKDPEYSGVQTGLEL